MPEIETYVFSYKEIVEALIKLQGIHEGIWQLHVEFGLAAQNIQLVEPGMQPQQDLPVSPAAIVPINKIGITKVSKENPLAVDASKVNP
jgi:hypothetical protein